MLLGGVEGEIRIGFPTFKSGSDADAHLGIDF